MDTATINLLAGWIGMLFGVVSGAVIGLFFHHDHWMGGYGSFRRRMIRLGHISFFGLGFLNLMFGLSAKVLALPPWSLRVASLSLIVGAITMPVCCFLTSWRQPLRYLFPIPVISILVGIMSLLMGWRTE